MAKKTIVILYENDRYAECALTMYKRLLENQENEVLIFNEKIYSPMMTLRLKNRIKNSLIRNFNYIARSYMAFRDKNLKARLNNSEKKKEKLISKYRDKTLKGDSSNRIRNIILRHAPDIIICFSKATRNLALKEKYRLKDDKISIVTVIAEFTLKGELVDFANDIYFVENEEVKKSLTELGISSDKIFVVPIYVSPECEKGIKDGEEEQIKFDNEHKTVYLNCGAYGNPLMKKVFNAIVEYTNSFNLIAETSENLSLEIFFKTVAKNKGAESVVICSKMSEFDMLNISDIVVCPPETSIMIKAMMAKKPIILTAPYGNLQKKNLAYAVEKGFALDGSDISKLIELILDTLKSNNEKLMQGATAYIEQNKGFYHTDDIIENNRMYLEQKARSIKEIEEAKILEEKEKEEKMDKMEKEINEKIDKIITAHKKNKKKGKG